jgi:hemolysin activation/secretion protein
MSKIINLRLSLHLAISIQMVIVSKATAQPVPNLNIPQPNRNQFPQSIPTPEPLPNQPPEIKPTPIPGTVPNSSSVKIPIQKVDVVGSTVLKPIEIQKITKAIEGKSVTLTELQEVANKITQYYFIRGYITSRAIIAPQSIVNGVVQIQVLEGSIEKVEILGLKRLRDAYVRSRIQLGIQKPFNQNVLEDQLRLLKNDPLLADLEAVLGNGTISGQSILTIKLQESNGLSGYVGTDNNSSPSTGAEKIGGILSYRNISGLGDELSASYFRSFQGGSNSFDFNYRLPVNAMNGTIQLRYAPSRSKITDPALSTLGIRSDNDLYEVSYRQPLLRSPREEFALSLGLAFQDGQTFVNENQPQPFGIGADANGNSRTRVIKFGQDYLSRDTQGAWALRSQFNLGVNIFNATVNTSPIPDGQFFSWVGQVQRAQRLNENNVLIAQADIQLTPNSLLPSQQFVVGGGQSVRGYSQNARTGDNGFRFSVEDRIALQKSKSDVPILQLAPFADLGAVWNRSDNPNNSSLPTQRFLSSIGLGLIYQPISQFSVRLDYAVPFLELNQANESAKNQTLSFNAGYSF